jgi:hypothetical protein
VFNSRKIGIGNTPSITGATFVGSTSDVDSQLSSRLDPDNLALSGITANDILAFFGCSSTVAMISIRNCSAKPGDLEALVPSAKKFGEFLESNRNKVEELLGSFPAYSQNTGRIIEVFKGAAILSRDQMNQVLSAIGNVPRDISKLVEEIFVDLAAAKFTLPQAPATSQLDTKQSLATASRLGYQPATVLPNFLRHWPILAVAAARDLQQPITISCASLVSRFDRAFESRLGAQLGAERSSGQGVVNRSELRAKLLQDLTTDSAGNQINIRGILSGSELPSWSVLRGLLKKLGITNLEINNEYGSLYWQAANSIRDAVITRAS